MVPLIETVSGLGMQVNYTYVDSNAPGPVAGTSVPLQGLSKPRDQIDASVGYKLSDHMTVTLDGVSLKQTKRSEGHSYFGEEQRPRFSNIFDRRISLLLRLTL